MAVLAYGLGRMTRLKRKKPETYFLNTLPDNLLVEQVHQQSYPVFRNGAPEASGDFHVGITID